MIYYLGEWLQHYWTPFYLLKSYSVLIAVSLFSGFLITRYVLPVFFKHLPCDRGREFTLSKEVSKGKPTGSGVVFVSFFVILSILTIPLKPVHYGILGLTWLMMLTGYLDDRSQNGWGEYIKAFLDFVIVAAAAVLLAWYLKKTSEDGKISFWFPFIKNPVAVPAWLFVIIATVLLWASVNTTNCTDGVDGLSSSLVLIALFTLGIIFHILLGTTYIAEYLHVPHLKDGAIWATMSFCFAGVLMGYLWHNAFPSAVLMGDAGSRALGFFIGVCVLASGNPLIFLATSSIIFVNGGIGLLKVALKRFLHISIFKNTRFPLHDHMRKNHEWSPTQVLIRFMMIQIMITTLMLGIFFKVR